MSDQKLLPARKIATNKAVIAAPRVLMNLGSISRLNIVGNCKLLTYRSGRMTAFYEKVKNVKADVAAVLV